MVKNIAIIVGNSEYMNLANLDCCLADVEAISDLLHATDKYESITKLTNKNSADLKDVTRSILDQSGNVDEIFLYFSGHGHQRDGEFFFCAVDFDISRPNETGLSHTELHTLLRAADANLIVKVVDACSSGTLLLKSDGGFLPEAKDGINNLIQIASCLDSQSSLTGDPLSAFTDSFYNAALSKEAGVVYYSDIINALRDRYIGNDTQTPHFVVQGTGREVFVENAEKLKGLREKRQEKRRARDESSKEEALDDESLDSMLDRIKALEMKHVQKDKAQDFIAKFFDDLNSNLENLEEIRAYYDYEHFEYDDYSEVATKSFIVRVLNAQNRPDKFVTAESSRERSSNNLRGLLSSYLSSDTYVTYYDLKLNCSIEKVQIKAVFTPKYQSLKQYTLIVSCAPSLETCYVFEFLTQEALSDWGKFETKGHEVNRRWYQLSWNESAAGVLKSIQDFLQNTLVEHIETVLERDDLPKNT